MTVLLESDHPDCVAILRDGGVIAYPTEGVMGVGCDPFSQDAVAKVRALKSRGSEQGLICVVSDWQQCADWVVPLADDVMAKVMDAWQPDKLPTTWIFQASEAAPKGVCAEDGSIALRLSFHPIVRRLCNVFGGGLVSTSANGRGADPCITVEDVMALWPRPNDQNQNGSGEKAVAPVLGMDAIVIGQVQCPGQVSQIRDATNGSCLRS